MPWDNCDKMDDYDEISVMDVYDIVTDFAKEFRPIIDMYGADPINNIMGKVVTMLERLEDQTVKIDNLRKTIQDRDAVIARLERDKAEKAAERQRFEKELEQIEEHWREESHEMVQLINRLQEENRKLIKSLAEKQDSTTVNNSQPLSPELDIAVLQKLRASNDKLREQLKVKEREVNAKAVEVDSLLDQVDRLTTLNKDLRKKIRSIQTQATRLIEERTDILTQLQDQKYESSILRQRLGIAEKEKEDLAQSNVDKMVLKTKTVHDSDDPNRPRFTTEELKEILRERNEYQIRVRELERELEKYKLKDSNLKASAVNTEDLEDDDDDDAPVQGPLPFEPNDAPWRKSESGIRKMFRKLFNETNITFLGNSPKRSLSSLSKMTLTTATTVEAPL